MEKLSTTYPFPYKTDDIFNIELLKDNRKVLGLSHGTIISTWNYARQKNIHIIDTTLKRRLSVAMPDSPKISTHRTSCYPKGISLSTQVNQHNKTFSTVEEYVASFVRDSSKARVIKKVLVATNGIAAVKCILSIRKLLMQLFKDDRIIKFICLTTEQEIQSHAEYLKMADYCVFSPAGSNNNNYANVNEIVEHAVRNNVDAVWAGWGHASENPELPKQLKENNIVFIGPPSTAMFALGDKIASTIIAQTVGVPTIDWSGNGLKLPLSDDIDEEVTIPKELYEEATVRTVEEGLESLKKNNITYPVMIKASEGGGGKGIRKCNNDQEFIDGFRKVQDEVPGSPIFLMKCMINARHIEVQLIGDMYGDVIPIYTRDCSIQRRCQKIIEEAPACIVPSSILYNMQRDAVNMAKKVGYVSAGTVEYMYVPATKEYYFLELNPRLQVEHPCTEMVANINIPAIQLQVGMGVPLNKITDIRLFFGLDRYGDDNLPEEQIKTETNICVIAARITSEDPAEGFTPASGSVEVLNFQSNQNVWGYFSVSSTGKVHEFADSQFGHLFAKGTTRHEAISNMLCALKELELRATFASQVQYLVGLLKEDDFEQNRFNTAWLDARIAAKVQNVQILPLHVNLAFGATVIGYAKIQHAFSQYQSSIERGQILPTSDLTETWQMELVHDNIKYSVLVNRYGPINFVVYLNGSICRTEVRELGNNTLLVTYSDIAFTCYLEEDLEKYKVTIGRSTVIFEKENDPSVLRSTNAGRLLRFIKGNGEKVSVDESYAEMESMKMVLDLKVRKQSGTLIHVARPGQTLFPGTLIAKLENQGDQCAPKPKDFEGRMIEWDSIEKERYHSNTRLVNKYEQLKQYCYNVMQGYSVPETVFKDEIKNVVNNLFTVMKDNNLPKNMFDVSFSAVASRIPRVQKDNLEHAKRGDKFQAQKIRDIIFSHLSNVDPKNLEIEKTNFDELIKISEKFLNGLNGNIKLFVEGLLSMYLKTELYFQGVTYDRAVSLIQNQVKNANEALRMIYSHTKITAKNLLLIEIISRLDKDVILGLKDTLRAVSNLFNDEAQKLALYAYQTLNSTYKQSTLYDNEFFNNNICNIENIKLYLQSTFCVDKESIKIINSKNNDIKFIKLILTPYDSLYRYIENTDETISTTKQFEYGFVVCSDLDLIIKEKDEVTNFVNEFNDPRKIHYIINDSDKGTDIDEIKKIIIQSSDPNGNEIDKIGGCMILRKDNEPIYINTEFGIYEKLQLSRLPKTAKIVSKQSSPFLIFKNDNKGITRYFARHLIKGLLSDCVGNSHANIKNLTSKFSDIVNSLSGEIRINAFNDKSQTVTVACNHIYICINMEKQVLFGSKNSNENNEIYKNRIFTLFSSAFKNAIGNNYDVLCKSKVTEVELVLNFPIPLKDVDDETKKFSHNEWVIGKFVFYNFISTLSYDQCFYLVDNDGYFIQKDLDKFVPLDSTIFKNNKYFLQEHRLIENATQQRKRFLAGKLNTTYVYDIPGVLAHANFERWRELKSSNIIGYIQALEDMAIARNMKAQNFSARSLLKAYELILNEKGIIEKCVDEKILEDRALNALNNVGMIAWEIEIYTPECYIEPLKIIVIANDITYKMGSFSMKEHMVYAKASEYSRKFNMPRIYISANSGARIGFAEDVKKNLKIQWINDDKPEDGYTGLTLDNCSEDVWSQVKYSTKDNIRYLEAVVGKENDIGVENLVGSGLIAGETSEAYNSVPTYCLVTARAVGIGAYAARLCRRICQVENSHLILTGAPALNSLLGREIYSSNGQLGGTQIMYNNGVSHTVAKNDSDGLKKILTWISYCPTKKNVLIPRTLLHPDNKERTVGFRASKAPYDTRKLLDNEQDFGIFDTNSFDEIMSGWAKTIIAGRARLCGLQVGVVAVETRTVECEIPADPATADSQTKVVMQAGQVWYPDSAYKTAEAINDFNKENLPLIMIANIRGFSGGQKDMFEMILKFGACIVDALHAYTQPVIVYIPPYGELRGGAWAVVDTNINKNCIKMFADPESRGGVLEPEGICEIKFRDKDLFACMDKYDPKLKKLNQQLADITLNGDLEYKQGQILNEIKKRREFLKPVYKTASVKFADMHDTTVRLMAQNAIHDVVPLKNSRNYFYNYLCKEVAINRMAKMFVKNVLHNGKDKIINLDELGQGIEFANNYISYKFGNISNVKNLYQFFESETSEFLAYIKDASLGRVIQNVAEKLNASSLDKQVGQMSNLMRQVSSTVVMSTLKNILLTNTLSDTEKNELLTLLSQ
ncbi:Carboxyl transferase domain and Biotin/lipoyl attachment domain and Carbamoyl-phosphate synthetase large subunit-like, ATP-binding domain and Carbamoyl-phosphate synthase, large subunit, N-terminal domain and Biotin carboxylase, C-terminal domain and Single hybrid motif domain and Rudiment single hybrid motif domain and ATP-grasp fold domain and Acetyl-coenzyme A carboxyltransferase, N-terminal domain and Acetyl-coenzyme A carboxyltransferase, C-terminal domain and Biotin carboxylation domain and Acetyl-Co|uniref:Acetyl-CoA carboxylase n=1 Tax=Strongyloides ratti TaxID=34506 RepID=A0A090N0X9_STRRB|nr:Carboxyl transferase domain and Biotin/lipoyl attachment domain and Carbamoyl-phosphate synthetase large subunit-like, ATP-binding domain and Carbamoyl-phosphate synthase, large subunit, N-terminal domain and Biotin carboxylase, C-terminal domain and Single hybrid motif domain and Rudiment single hybrid motif domain and ATP-grasp fold domain and Acetyl-coenzyme A carboxyltransferase, N-terminal domain and Acetyl-coenzyme A carboxyltransferase, C-terminal domain and Biotin carboxylation domain an